MKTISILAVLAIVICCTRNQQKSTENKTTTKVNSAYKRFSDFKKDTTKYLNHNFVINKQAYVGKKFSVLLQDLELGIKDYTYGNVAWDRSISSDINIGFYEENEATQRIAGNTRIDIIDIDWDQPIPKTDIENLNKAYGTDWSEKHAAFFGERVIKDINVVSFPHKIPSDFILSPGDLNNK